VALRIVRRRELAEEILHDAFTRIWYSARSFDPVGGSPVGWMAAIVRHRALDVMESHDVARVDSYHETPDADAEGALDRLYDWSGGGEDERLDDRRVRAFLRRCLGELAARAAGAGARIRPGSESCGPCRCTSASLSAL
jgi:RNA polymerase sigma-70 factor (ECF subfamily)